MIGIYIIEGKDGSAYVGSSINIRKRYKEHVNDLKANRHRNIHLQRSYNKHGAAFFSFRMLEILDSTDNILYYEQLWIDIIFTSLDRTQIINIAPKAGNTLGRKHSEETKQKIRLKALGRKKSDQERLTKSIQLKGNTYAKGYKHSEETRQKVTAAALGRKHTEETKRKMSEAAKRRYSIGKNII